MNTMNLAKNIKFFINRRRAKKSPSFDCFEKNFCLLDQFRQRLFIEKRRSERLNYRSSIIQFHLKIKTGANRTRDNFRHLVNNVCKNLRATDSVCLYKTSTLLILLPDTAHKGARYVCERLMQGLIQQSKSNLYLNEFKRDDIEIEILSYPEKVVEKNFLENKMLYRKLATQKKKQEKRQIVHPTVSSRQFSVNYLDNLNLSVSVLNGSSLALPGVDTFFWDQELIDNLLMHINKFFKRVIDITVSLIALIFFIPIMIPVTLLVKLTSPGPILFKQKRVGYRGKQFTFYKFRTMYSNNDTSSHKEFMKQHIHGNNEEINNGGKDDPLYKMKNDSRITPMGRILRRTSIDELPQIWNVLKGEMSLVGPRPPIPYEVQEYQNWHYRRVTEVKPGITGLWQVSGRNRTTFDEMVRLDIHYSENWSVLMDLKILFKTVKAVFMAEGT